MTILNWVTDKKLIEYDLESQIYFIGNSSSKLNFIRLL